MKKLTIIIACIMLVAGVVAGAAVIFKKNPEPGMPPTQAQEADRSQHNFTDVDFAKQMIIYHQQALEMTSAVLQKSANSDVRQLAQNIATASGPEVIKLQGLLTRWGEAFNNLSDFPRMSGHDLYPTLPGMATPDDMTKLENMSGTELDREFLRMTLEHHKSSIERAQRQQQNGQFGELIDLAKDIESRHKATTARINELTTP